MTGTKGFTIQEFDTHCSVHDHNDSIVFVGDTRDDALFWIQRVEWLITSSQPPAERESPCQHDWKIWPETDGQEQRCMKCGDHRKTPRPPRYPDAISPEPPENAQ